MSGINNLQGNNQLYDGISLNKYERVIPVYAILNLQKGHELALTDEQRAKVNEEGLIKVGLLTEEQLEEIESAISFDYEISRIKGEFSSEVFKYL